MTVDPYVDPASGVLRNRLCIADAQRLCEVDAGLTRAALADLDTRILPGGYDLAHLRCFHREIFGDLYPWAGDIRVVGIARSDPFCLPQHIEAYSADVFDALAKERYLRGLSRDRFIDRLTHYFAEVNAIHPFREGNGRTQRAFFRQLGREAGWFIDWSSLDPDSNAHASKASLRGDNGPLRTLLDSLLSF
ncbi:cell filamentation protein Fic [Nonomuraea turkmeniaca]|uniref:protein adenylyltransferase n=1 Tax=Nonomuraea turkmeniaca TaxID=103838 RepID=A0A5S4FC40_9ACTN|nr:Fic family protein [Nonomuraea turkmeniaca]TMR15478.1 cell filamentation protein Fic [Nonomuraea turkmeniaca]